MRSLKLLLAALLGLCALPATNASLADFHLASFCYHSYHADHLAGSEPTAAGGKMCQLHLCDWPTFLAANSDSPFVKYFEPSIADYTNFPGVAQYEQFKNATDKVKDVYKNVKGGWKGSTTIAGLVGFHDADAPFSAALKKASATFTNAMGKAGIDLKVINGGVEALGNLIEALAVDASEDVMDTVDETLSSAKEYLVRKEETGGKPGALQWDKVVANIDKGANEGAGAVKSALHSAASKMSSVLHSVVQELQYAHNIVQSIALNYEAGKLTGVSHENIKAAIDDDDSGGVDDTPDEGESFDTSKAPPTVEPVDTQAPVFVCPRRR